MNAATAVHRGPRDGVELSATLVDLADVGTTTDLYVRLGSQTELHARQDDADGLVVGEDCVVTMSYGAIEVWTDASSPTP